MKSPAHVHRAILLVLPLTCLLLVACNSTIRSQGHSYTGRSAMGAGVTAQAADESFATVFALAAPMYLYYVENECWPTDASQVQELARKFDIPFDLSSYSSLDMKELQDGRLRVHFHLAPPSQSEGEFTLSKPDMDKDITPYDQDALMV